MDSRFRGGRALAKTEEEVAPELMIQVQKQAPEEKPPAMATDGKGAYRAAMLQTWGKGPHYRGQGRPAPLPKPDKDWHYLHVGKKRQGSRLVGVHLKGVSGDPEEGQARVGAHTADVERTKLTSRPMNGRLVRNTLSFSKELRFLEAASWWEDARDNFTRPVKTLRVEREDRSPAARWRPRTPPMAADLTEHLWTGKRACDDCACSCSYHHPIGRLPESVKEEK